jgi:16S rRNA (guanine527-N7)-methyltransferase
MPTKGNNELAPVTSESIHSILAGFGLAIPDHLAEQIRIYLDLLIRWNQKVSLTAIRDSVLILDRHFGESLFGAMAVGIETGALLDVGSGAGFPGLPIAMFRQEIRVTLLEPNIKKSAFLAEVSRSFGLSDRVRLSRRRLEEFSANDGFDFITSRAVRVTPEFLGQCAKLLRPDGRLVLWLGDRDAMAASSNPHWGWNPPIRIPGSEQRCVISAIAKDT